MSNFIDWNVFIENFESYCPQGQTMWLQLLRPEVQKEIRRLRDEWGIPPEGLPHGYKVPDNLSMIVLGHTIYFDTDIQCMLMEYFKMPVEYLPYMKHFVLYGVPLPDKNKKVHAIRNQAKNIALEAMRKMDVQSRDDLRQLKAKCINTVIFIDPDRRKIIVEQSIASPAEEIQAMMPVIEAYKVLGVKILGDVTAIGSKKSIYSGLIDVLISQSLASGHSSNRAVIADVQCRFKSLYPDVSIETVKEFKMNKNGVYTAVNKRIQRVRRMIKLGGLINK